MMAAAAGAGAVSACVGGPHAPRSQGHSGPASRPGEAPLALAFDAFPVFDPRPINALANELSGGRGPELVPTWRTRMFEYQWQRALAAQYADFEQCTADGLEFSLTQLGITISEADQQRLVDAHRKLNAWPDAPAALTELKEAGFNLVFLSNMTEGMLRANIETAGLESVFDDVLSTDSVQSYKPSPRAYEIGPDRLGLSREEILFVAFAGWDVAGAKWFGYPTFWVNRLGAPMEALGVQPDGVGANLNDLVAFAKSWARGRRPER